MAILEIRQTWENWRNVSMIIRLAYIFKENFVAQKTNYFAEVISSIDMLVDVQVVPNLHSLGAHKVEIFARHGL